jgi:molybdopterin-guanine dinucleotide biosynthesis protein A
MGRAKAGIRLGRLTLLAQVRANVADLGLPVRIIRKDLVARCGPLGGIYTGLKRTKASAVLFLPCDSPFLSAALLRRFIGRFDGKRPLFGEMRGKPGFPIILPRWLLPLVYEQIRAGKFALHDLARAAKALFMRVPADQGFNINTPEDLAEARQRLAR